MSKQIVPATQDLEGILVQRVLCGDHEAFYELVKPCQRMIMCAALSILHNHADAEEVAQEALLKAIRNFASFRRQSKFSTWVVQITINEARMRLRKYRLGSFVSLHASLRTAKGSYVLREYADWRELPFAVLETRELCNALRNAFDSLPAKYKEVLLLRDLNQVKTREAAFALDINEANVKTRLFRARSMMRRALRSYYPSGSTHIDRHHCLSNAELTF